MPQVAERPTVRATETDYSAIAQVVYCPGCGVALIRVPVLRCANCNTNLVLRAFAYSVKQGYIAECIDLNLATQGKTEEEAISKLQVAMFGYLDTVFDGTSTEGLVLRLSPLRNRLRYHLHRLAINIECLFRRRRRAHLIPVQPDDRRWKLCHC